ncbi:TlpA family protein disulfide reductase [bacterium]|nr:TlpA family protein disulfide reductase [bacterium]
MTESRFRTFNQLPEMIMFSPFFFRIRLVLVALFIMIWAGCSPSGHTDLVNVSAAPDFSLQTLSGKTVSLSELRGKVVLLNFWATWCRPCHMEIPYLKSLYKSFDLNQFEILAISDEGRQKIHPFVEKYELPYPVLLASQSLIREYNIRAYPTLYLIDKEGIIQYKWEGLHSEQTLSKAIKQLIEG